MFPSRYFPRCGFALVLLCMAITLTACQSKMDKAIEQAKQQANQTGQPQQVVAVDSKGVTTTTVVQPRSNGQTTQAVTTSTTPAPAGGAVPPPQAPKIVPLGGDATQFQAQGQNNAPGATPSAAAPAPQVVTIPAGTSLAVRIDRQISVKTSRAGDGFTGEVVEPVMDATGNTIIPKGTPVSGVIDTSRKRGHFKGASDLRLRLTAMTLNGVRQTLHTRDIAEHKKGKGKRSTAIIGGGAGLGMLLGGLAGGPKGLAIGGAAGAGAGTAAAGMTGNRDLVIPANTVLHFKLSQEVVLQND